MVMDTHFMAKYMTLTSGRPSKNGTSCNVPAPWDIQQSRLYDWTPETMHHDVLRLLTRHPKITKFEMISTLEEDYEKMEENDTKTLQGNSDDHISDTSEEEEKPELILTDRKFHNGRKYVITVNDNEDEEYGSEENPINCWDSYENKKDDSKKLERDEKRETSSCPSQEADKVNNEAQKIDEFNTACGDYEKPFQHERRLRLNNGSKSDEEKPKPKRRRLMVVDSDSEDDSDIEGDISDETIDQLAHVISDDEGVSDNGFFDKEKLTKKLEKMTEIELQKNYDAVDDDIGHCRTKIRRRIERKFKGVKGHKKVTQLHRLKAKMKIIDAERTKRLAMLKKERNKLKARKIMEIMNNSRKRLDEKWPSKGQNPRPGKIVIKLLMMMHSKEIQKLITQILISERLSHFKRSPRCPRFQKSCGGTHCRCRLHLPCVQQGGRPPRVRHWRGRSRPRLEWGRLERVQWLQYQQQHVQQLLQRLWRRSHEGLLETYDDVMIFDNHDISTFYSINNNLMCNHLSMTSSQNESNYDYGDNIAPLSVYMQESRLRSRLRIFMTGDKITVRNTSTGSTCLYKEGQKRSQKIVTFTITCVQGPSEKLVEDENCLWEDRMESERREGSAPLASALPTALFTAAPTEGESGNCSGQDKILEYAATYNYFSPGISAATTSRPRPFSGLKSHLPPY